MTLPNPVDAMVKLARTMGMGKKLQKRAQQNPFPGINLNEYPFQGPETDPSEIDIGQPGSPLSQNVWNSPEGFRRGQQYYRQQTRPDREMLANIRQNAQRDINQMVEKWRPWARGRQKRLRAYDRILNKARIMEAYPHAWRQILARQPRKIVGRNRWEAYDKPTSPLVEGQGQWVRREGPGGGWEWAWYGSPLARRAGLRAPQRAPRQPAAQQIARSISPVAQTAQKLRQKIQREKQEQLRKAREIGEEMQRKIPEHVDYAINPYTGDVSVRTEQGIRTIPLEDFRQGKGRGQEQNEVSLNENTSSGRATKNPNVPPEQIAQGIGYWT